MVHNQNQRYFEGEKEIEVQELRLRNALTEHNAWIAVDLLDTDHKKNKAQEAYPKIGRLVAELGGHDCLAILCPETGFVGLYDDTTEEKLRTPDPLRALQDSEHIPVIAVPEGDPRMIAAVEEARDEPEFGFDFSFGDDIDARIGKAAGSRPARLAVGADFVFFAQVGGSFADDIYGWKLISAQSRG